MIVESILCCRMYRIKVIISAFLADLSIGRSQIFNTLTNYRPSTCIRIVIWSCISWSCSTNWIHIQWSSWRWVIYGLDFILNFVKDVFLSFFFALKIRVTFNIDDVYFLKAINTNLITKFILTIQCGLEDRVLFTMVAYDWIHTHPPPFVRNR